MICSFDEFIMCCLRKSRYPNLSLWHFAVNLLIYTVEKKKSYLNILCVLMTSMALIRTILLKLFNISIKSFYFILNEHLMILSETEIFFKKWFELNYYRNEQIFCLDCHEKRSIAKLGPCRVLRPQRRWENSARDWRVQPEGEQHPGPVLHPWGERYQHLHEPGDVSWHGVEEGSGWWGSEQHRLRPVTKAWHTESSL